jgi:hypothetical protein
MIISEQVTYIELLQSQVDKTESIVQSQVNIIAMKESDLAAMENEYKKKYRKNRVQNWIIGISAGGGGVVLGGFIVWLSNLIK